MNALAATPTHSQTDSLLGCVIGGKYRLDKRIGEGATGVVYEALQLALGLRVAIKVLHRELQSHLSFVSRFHVEARAASAITHEHTTRVLDFGVDPAHGFLYICMEHLEGQTLATMLRSGNALPPARIVDIVLQLLGALGAAHKLGILHRDLRPQHIVVQQRVNDDARTRDFVKVSDFGIAPLEYGAVTGAEATHLERLTTRASEYMAPEQALGGVLDARSDIYAVGVILSQMLTGRSPFATGSGPRLRVRVDPELETISRRAMSPAPGNRYGSARQMRAALQATSTFRALMAPEWPAEASSSGTSISASFDLADSEGHAQGLHVATPFVAIPLADVAAVLSDQMATRRPPPMPAAAPAVMPLSMPSTMPPPSVATSLEPTYSTVEVDDVASEVRSQRAATMVSARRSDLAAKRARSTSLLVATGGMVAGILALAIGWRHLDAPVAVMTEIAAPPVTAIATGSSSPRGPVAASQLPSAATTTATAQAEAAPQTPALATAPMIAPLPLPTPKPAAQTSPIAAIAPPLVKPVPAPLTSTASPVVAAPPPNPVAVLQIASTTPVAPGTPAPAALVHDPDAARVDVVSTQTERVNARAVNDALRHVSLQRCYADALRRAGAARSATGGTAVLTLSIDESRVASSNLRGVDLPGLSSCVSGQLANVRVGNADMGSATASVTLRFSAP